MNLRALEQAYRESHDSLYGAAMNITRSRPHAEDALHAAVLATIEADPAIEDSDVARYLGRAVVNHARRQFTQRMRVLEAYTDAPDVVSGPEEISFARDRLRILNELPTRQRHAYVLQALGFNYDEIGRLAGFTHRQTDRYLVKARKRLRALEALPPRGQGGEARVGRHPRQLADTPAALG